MTRGRAALLAAPVLALVLAGCGSGAAGTPDVGAGAAPATVGASTTAGAPTTDGPVVPRPANGATLDVEEFATAITAPGTVVLDVRTPAEFADGHLEGAQNLDVSSPAFATTLEQLDPDATYAVYCRSGSRSAAALEQMLGRGFTAVYHLDGGIGAWSATGRATAS